MAYGPEIRGATIVLRGHFSPAIFQPAWFASKNLLRQSEAEAADIELIHPKAAVFSAAWLQIQILETNFQASTSQVPYFEPLRDLALGAFEILNQTPVRALGINQNFHFPLDSEEKWHQVGHKLAPKELWDSLLQKPGMQSLTIQAVRQDTYDGYIRVKVEPSVRVKYGIFIDVNDHYQLAKTDDVTPGTSTVISILSSKWTESIDKGFAMALGILQGAISS